MRSWILALVSSATVLACGTIAPAVTFNITYSSSVTSSPYSAQIQAACSYVAQTLSNSLNDPITVNIYVQASSSAGLLGQSQTSLSGPYTFAQVHTALANHAAGADDTAALATLTTDPTGGASMYLSTAQAKALGLSGPSTARDGTFTFGTTLQYTYDPNNRAVGGAYDFIGVAYHEFTEVMGRIPFLGPQFGIYDLFRYSSSGVRNITSSGAGIWFSVDGTHLLKQENNADANGGDPDDWASGTNDAFNAFSGSGVANAFSAVDLRVMDAIGFTAVTCGPVFTTEPTSQSVCPGSSITLSSSASSSSTVSYQWQKLGVPLSDGPTGAGSTLSGTKTSNLTITNAGGFDANSYACIAANSCGSTSSNTVSVSLGGTPTIAVQPSDFAVCSGQPASFNVFASAVPSPTFQWQHASGAPISDGPTGSGSIISGSASPSLTITNVQPTDLDSYQCVITNSCSSITTNSAALTYGTGPAFVSEPTPSVQKSCPGGTAAISVVVSGSPDPTYVWKWQPPHGAVPITVVEGVNTDPTTGLASFTATGSQTASPAFSNFSNVYKNGTLIGLSCTASNFCSSVGSSTAAISICIADFNCSHRVTVQDIFDFLSAWFAAAPLADFNNSGSVTVQDIFDYLAAWFNGGC